MERLKRNQMLLDFAYSIIDLVEENHTLAKECKYLTEYKERNDEYNKDMLKKQQESIGSLLKTLIHQREDKESDTIDKSCLDEDMC